MEELYREVVIKSESNQTPKQDLMNEALKHYEEAANAIHHYNSDIPKAIKLYYTEVPIEPVASQREEIENFPVYDEKYLNECRDKARENLSKIKDVDKWLKEIRGREEIEYPSKEIINKQFPQCTPTNDAERELNIRNMLKSMGVKWCIEWIKNKKL